MGGLRRLFTGWADAPYMSGRDVMGRPSLLALITVVWATVTAEWLVLLCSVPVLILVVVLGLFVQYRATVTGKVEEEEREREEARIRQAAWLPWERWLFRLAAMSVMALIAVRAWADLR